MAAEWNDDNTRIVTELFAEQVRRGNRPNTHLNSVGYEEVSKRFKEGVGLVYQKIQLKNKWDKLKNEYGIWKKLMQKETGAGWNIEKGTIEQDSEWWKKAKAAIPGCGRFQKHGIHNEDNLKVMFEDIMSDGTDHWSPASGMLPQAGTQAPQIVNLEAGDNNYDEAEVAESPSTAKGKRPAMLMDDRDDRRAYPHLKDCIGALDGTHIRASLPLDKQVRYIGRSGTASQNVLAICNFDMRFTYTSIGQPGAMHDTSVLYHALSVDRAIFPHPPKGKYYLVDAGYPNRPGYLAPYKDERYHVPEFHRGVEPNTPKEKFNRVHSSVRNVIERSFGVLKMKWQILLKMPSYPMEKQKMIVAAAMTLHNFVREHDNEDEHFLMCDRDPNYVPTIPLRYRKYAISQDASDASTSELNDLSMDNLRDELATAISLSW